MIERACSAKPRNRVFIGIVLLCWVWMNLWVLLRYEPWRDLAQSWIIARDLSVPEMFLQLRQEGHPFLWFALLMPLAKLGLPFASIYGLSFALTLAGLWLFLRNAPFGRLMKLVVVFSAAGMYYLPVVARSYALVPPLLMLLYGTFPRRYERPMAFALALFWLCQVHVLLCGLVGGLMLQWAVGLPRAWKERKAPPARLLAALLCMGAAIGLLALQLGGSVEANQAVSIRGVAHWDALRRYFLQALDMGVWYLTTIHFYELGNTFWWLALAPVILGVVALGGWWLWRAPRSAVLLLCALGWQLSVHALVYAAHMQHMLTFLWMLLFCLMLAKDELRARSADGHTNRDALLARALTGLVAGICLLSCAQAYPTMREQCSPASVNSEASEAAAYITTQLPADAVVLVDSEDMASPVAALCPPGKLYNPIRQNWRVFSQHDAQSSGWCATGSLDAAVVRLREAGVTGALYLLTELRSEKAALGMSERSTAKLTLIQRFDRPAYYERYLLYAIHTEEVSTP